MKTIKDREDIGLLVHSFYSKIRSDKKLGPIFNSHIPEDQWTAHLNKLTDFWETNLFGVAAFTGNPTAKHMKVDAGLDFSLDQQHFESWLSLWYETIEQHFSGECAEKAKNFASRMAKSQYLSIVNNRSRNNKSGYSLI